MMNRQISGQLTASLAVLEQVDGRLAPDAGKKIGDALGDCRRVERWRPEGADLTGAVAAAITAGKDPASDKAVLAAIAAERCFEAREGVSEVAGRALGNIAREHLEAIVDAFKPAYRQAGDRLAAARTVLTAHGIGHDTEPSIILKAGTDATAAWSEATAAVAVLSKIKTQLGSLYTVCDVSLAEPSLAWVDAPDMDLYQVRALGRSPHPWRVIDAGGTLELGSPAQCAERQRRAAAAVEAKAEKEERDAAQRPSYLPKARPPAFVAD